MEKIEIIGIATGSVVSILTGVAVITNYIFNKGVDKNRIDTVIKRFDALSCSEHSNEIMKNKLAINMLEQKQSIAEKEVSHHTVDIDIIKQWIMKFDASMVDKLARKHSPRELTELGKKVLEMSGANEILPRICDVLIADMEQRRINTAFDAETEAYFAMLRNDKNEAFNGLKNYIYNAPDSIDVEVAGEVSNVKLDYTSIVRVLSLNLRDEYIRRHPEIKG